jgi:phage FluMu gp28-like protein
MASVKTGLNLDELKSDYWLPYQKEYIEDESPRILTEKSVRIGFTYTDAFKQTRKRLRLKKRDYLFTTKDQVTAYEYVRQCVEFLEMYGQASSIVSRGIEEIQVPGWDTENNQPTGFMETQKVGYVALDSKSRILAFSGNPNSLRAYGGDVGWDEADFQQRQPEMWATIQGRIRWGYDVSVWSSRSGAAATFAELCEMAKKEGSGWKYNFFDIHRAIADGLVEKINQVQGTNFTRKEFLEQCRKDALTVEVFEQEYECKPAGGKSPLVSWARLMRCIDNYAILRAHLPQSLVNETFGIPAAFDNSERKRKVESYIKQIFGPLMDGRKYKMDTQWRIGFDVASSGAGDLTAISIFQRVGNGSLVMRALLTLQTEDWDVIEWCLWYFLGNLPGHILAAGDETGLGKQICARTSNRFYGKFQGVNFGREKANIGTHLMNCLTEGTMRLPKSQPDVIEDFKVMRKDRANAGKYVFSEGRNSANKNSHCDIAWASGLAQWAECEMTNSQLMSFQIAV